jgi:5'-nucleotidase
LNILVTNDDGIYSSGIFALWEVAKEFGQACVVAPESQKSAVGHGITISKPLFINNIKRSNGFEGHAVSGSPADCVKVGIKRVLNKKPDLILSGINLGSNLGNNIIYSGTVAGALEGSMQHISSIAFSVDSFEPKSFETSKYVIREAINFLLKQSIPKQISLNVNIPDCTLDQLKGLKITLQGGEYFEDDFNSYKDPKGNSYYWIKGEMVDNDDSFDSDSFVIKNNYASITPISFKMSDNRIFQKLKSTIK